MTNITGERMIEGDWWQHPIPPNVVFGDGFYCESAQVFRFLKSKAPRALVFSGGVSEFFFRRELRDFTSELTAIPGVGDKRKGRLLRHFGSIQRISKAGVSELTPFVGRKTAEEIADHFERQRLLAANHSEDTDKASATS